MNVLVDTTGRWAVREMARTAELWISERIAFDNRPAWQSAPDGPVAALHRALSRLEPDDSDVLACVWACADLSSRPDVENRLFTNVIPKLPKAPHGPNPFAHLPARVLFERSFRSAPALDGFDTSRCLYYRYALTPPSDVRSEWQTFGTPLASWSRVPATGLSTGNGWATWASMRRPGIMVATGDNAVPHTGDFALRLLIRTPGPFALVSNMEWIIDGAIASLQREQDHTRAEVIARLIRPHLARHQLDHDLIVAQVAAPRVFARPPFQLYKNQAGCRLNPADDLLVRATVELTIIPELTSAELSGTIRKVSLAN